MLPGQARPNLNQKCPKKCYGSGVNWARAKNRCPRGGGKSGGYMGQKGSFFPHGSNVGWENGQNLVPESNFGHRFFREKAM